MHIKKKTNSLYFLFIISHLFLWTVIPSVSNINLPLDTIEALAWGSNLSWGFEKHPPLSAFAAQIFYIIFNSSDWAFYLLSQIFIIISFFYVWKFSNLIFKDKIYSFLSVIILESIFFYNFTSPEFNVNISQLPFWALSVYFFWKAFNYNKRLDWILLGFFSAMGLLSKYLFVYIVFTFFLILVSEFKKNKKLIKNYSLSIIIMFIFLTPHLFWLFDNSFKTIFYGLNRSGLDKFLLVDHVLNPVIFVLKQFVILIPFFFVGLILIKKLKLTVNLKDKKTFFLISINLIPIILILFTSIITGAQIRTMWMTPFYLFMGVLFFHLFKNNIEIKRLNRFLTVLLVLFLFSPSLYFGISVMDKTKRTDYPGKEVARLVQNKWDDNFTNEIKIVIGDEWSAGNLSYHLGSRPKWYNDLKDKRYEIEDHQGVIYTGNPKILKKICPGVFGTIKPIGYCMIGKR